LTKTDSLINELIAAGDQSDAQFLQRFFKTGKDEYGEGDKFLGIRVPKTRKIATKYQKIIDRDDLDVLLNNEWREVRFAALVIMKNNFEKTNNVGRKQLFNLYLEHIGRGINNWDLVDISCPSIVGSYLFNKNRQILYKLSKGSLWQKRVSIISTFYFIRNGDLADTYKLAETLIYDRHDLLNKAVGWALREMGKSDIQLLRKFLDIYAATMPRTTLRYAIEKLDYAEKSKYMSIKYKI
jgi:3-methyladenine DNA glycosylase AlkD